MKKKLLWSLVILILTGFSITMFRAIDTDEFRNAITDILMSSLGLISLSVLFFKEEWTDYRNKN